MKRARHRITHVKTSTNVKLIMATVMLINTSALTQMGAINVIVLKVLLLLSLPKMTTFANVRISMNALKLHSLRFATQTYRSA